MVWLPRRSAAVSTKKVIVRVRNTNLSEFLPLRVPRNMNRVMMPHRRQNTPIVSPHDPDLNTSVFIATSASQNTPYRVKAVIPKVFPLRYSNMPAMICAIPPQKIPIARVTLSNCVIPALCRESRTVVIPNPRSPKGAGLAFLAGFVSSVMECP